MSEVNLKFKLVHPFAQMPSKSRRSDAGLDLYTPEDCVIDPMSQVLIDLGIQSEFFDGWVAWVVDRSGLALKGLHVTAGIIDSNYRKNWGVSMWNLGDRPFGFHRGDRVAQVIMQPIVNLLPKQVEVLSESPREAGWGSSGR